MNLYWNSSSSSSDEENLNNIERRLLQRRRIRIPSRIQNFLEVTVPRFTTKEFQSHFRITREAYNYLLVKLNPFLIKTEGSVGRLQISVEKQILSVLWLLATPDSYRSVGCRFNMGKSSLFACFTRVVCALNNICHDVIRWPNRQERAEIKRQFYAIRNLHGVIGAIDGTYVPIKAPKENAEVYINRKCFHGITLQCVCTPMLKFIDCFTGYPSSVSDARIFRNSDIYLAVNNSINRYFDDDEFIIGDKAYPVLKWCIPPYIERGNVTVEQTRFNRVHASTRQVIERAFALLFGRFRRLRYLDMNRLDMIPATIIACCVLHNICLLEPDELINVYINEGELYVANDYDNNAIPHNINQNEGILRRNQLSANL